MKNLLPYFYCFFFVGCIVPVLHAQQKIEMEAVLKEGLRTIFIQQRLQFTNTSDAPIKKIYLHDWNNAYADSKSDLSIRLTEEFKRNLFLAREEDKGNTCINAIVDTQRGALQWRYSKQDIIELILKKTLAPGESIHLKLDYEVKLPNAKFTGYGKHHSGYNLRYWYIWPCNLENGQWKLYSNKNLNDGYFSKTNYDILFKYPVKYRLQSSLPFVQQPRDRKYKSIRITAENRKESKLFLTEVIKSDYQTFQTNYLKLITNFKVRHYPEAYQAVSVNRISEFISDYLGKFPYEHLLVTQFDYEQNPLYGLNQLPRFLKPYSEQFQYELGLLKTVLDLYLQETIHNDPRAEYWIKDAYHNYLLAQFVKKYYPDSKLIGSFANTWLFRSFHYAKVGFNQQYPLFYNVLSRRNQEQSLITPKDSLIKYNFEIANRYKAGLGMVYLGDFIGENTLKKAVKDFYEEQQRSNQKFKADAFRAFLKKQTPKEIDWFFDTYVSTNKSIDFKIKKIEKVGDSIDVVIKNKTKAAVPVSLFAIHQDQVLGKYWLESSDSTFTKVRIPHHDAKKLVINYQKHIPEINERNNWKSLGGFLGNNRKIRLTFFKDIENPFYNQLFWVPTMKYNFYDGIALGMRVHNKSFLRRPLVYDFRPAYGLKSRSLVGNGGISYQHYMKDQAWYVLNGGIVGSSFHYGPNLRFYSFTPSVSFGFRPNDMRSNKRDFINFRYVNIFRTRDDSSIAQEATPDYSVWNLRYFHQNNNVIQQLGYVADFQISDKFSKLSFNLDYRKLFHNKTQINFRFYFGKFLRNNTSDDFFSYALDRPTDYLFDYNYYGRSENSGLFSQQLIIAEGGFKSKLKDPFANDWIATTNMSVNLWKWIELYGDIGFIRNLGQNPRFVYDSGIRLNLLTDYFELYFPIYSNNGWEIGQENYDQNIRFIVTLSPRTLIGLFTRKWF
ncbi:MAG: metalloprotease [Flavobacteriaceae bacterium]|nr:metalloprotease [Flavobacteriaceae bacterium]